MLYILCLNPLTQALLEERWREQEHKHKLPFSSEKIPNERGGI